MNREQIRDVIVENIGPSVSYNDAGRAADELLAALTAESDRYRAAIDAEMTRHTEKHGETARYEAGDFDHELPPTHWEPYVICNACGTDYPCRTRQTLTRALNENGETDGA